MRVNKINIKFYRSIKDITICFPENKPVVLFGPNNAGKSNILSAISRILGERYPTYIEMLDSDRYMRDKTQYPSTTICVTFSKALYQDRIGKDISQIAVTYGTKEKIHSPKYLFEMARTMVKQHKNTKDFC